jgi:hypothetical protein
LTVLETAIRYLDDHPGSAGMRLGEIAEATGLELGQVWTSARYLESVGYVEIDGGTGAGGAFKRIDRVSGAALRQAGAWPTPENLAARLLAELETMADAEPDTERRGKLKAAAAVLGQTATATAVGGAGNVLGAVVMRALGMG